MVSGAKPGPVRQQRSVEWSLSGACRAGQNRPLLQGRFSCRAGVRRQLLLPRHRTMPCRATTAGCSLPLGGTADAVQASAVLL